MSGQSNNGRQLHEVVTNREEEANQAELVAGLLSQLKARGVRTTRLEAVTTEEEVNTRAAATRAAAHAAGTAQTPEQTEAMKRAHGYGQ